MKPFLEYASDENNLPELSWIFSWLKHLFHFSTGTVLIPSEFYSSPLGKPQDFRSSPQYRIFWIAVCGSGVCQSFVKFQMVLTSVIELMVLWILWKGTFWEWKKMVDFLYISRYTSSNIVALSLWLTCFIY